MILWVILVGVVFGTLASCGGGGGGGGGQPPLVCNPSECPFPTDPRCVCIIRDDHGNTPAEASFLASGESRTGRIEMPGDVDVFRISISQRGTLTVFTTGLLDTVGELHDGRALVGQDDDSGDGVNFSIAHDATAGIYYVFVSSFLLETGNYTVWARFEAAASNRAPERRGSIPGQTLIEGSSDSLDVSSFFEDPEGEALTYTTQVSDSSVVTVEVSGDRVTLRAISMGVATVRVVAADPHGASVSQDFTVQVEEDTTGIGRGQVGDEFGRNSTTGRSFNLTCTDDVIFRDAGNVILPSVDIVTLPREAGTVTLEYEAFNIPDRFVVEVDRRIMVDTQYVGSSHTVAEVNDVLDRYNFRRTSQSSIITPGHGTEMFQKNANVTSAVVRVYAPLPGTAWEVTLSFQSASCQQTNRAPERRGSIPGQTLIEGSSDSLDVSSFFEDPEGEALTYTTQVSDSSVVTVEVSGDRVTLRAISMGVATVRVVAADPHGASVSQDFTVQVEEDTTGIGRGQVGDEFGRNSTTGRSFNLTCTDDVIFRDAGNVILPSVDIVTLPREAGTVTLEYEAFNIPDRFVVEVDRRIMVDTQYVGSSHTVAEVNDVLDRYNFRRTSQSSIITPGHGTEMFQKNANVTSAVVRVYAPLPGTAWEVTLSFQSASCQQTNNPPVVRSPIADVDMTAGQSVTYSLNNVFSDPDGDPLAFSAASNSTPHVTVQVSGNRLTVTAVQGFTSGGVTITVTARDRDGRTAQDVFVVRVAGGRSFGAIAGGYKGQFCQDGHAGAIVGRSDRQTARSDALARCRQGGGLDCEVLLEFGSAFSGDNDCGAVAYGEGQTQCGLYPGSGNTESVAESAALADCRQDGFNCSLVSEVGGGRFATCVR